MLLDSRDIKASELSRIIDVTAAGISEILKHNSDPMWNTALKIINSFPENPISYWFDQAIESNDKLALEFSRLAKDCWALNEDVRKTLIDASKALANQTK
jgi:DNA-binding XRE family transcriptional regulator